MSKQKLLVKKLVASFSARWDNWRNLFAPLVEEPAGRLICPTSRELEFLPQEQSIQVKLPYSICIYGIPRKLSSNKGSDKLAVFIDGNYELEQNKEENLRRIKSSIAYYKVKSQKTAELSLLDAYHFDFFDSPPNGHAPHPIFHAQRNFRFDDAEPRFVNALQRTPAIKDVTIKPTTASEQSKLFQFGSLRIPTPQMDIFNLSAVVAADQLVGNDSHKRWQQFQRLLSTIHGVAGDVNHIKTPDQHIAKIYEYPRKNVADWYLARTE